ncbi:MAG: UDP-N-acetylglucosamine 2-epimerase (non-hydrolyzing) [Saprospiraceae bacterium]|nr:UDP-N-acetylglucosamine 2-epimerase (non-hydrolyzing) [Saprospiraceae bacterium]
MNNLPHQAKTFKLLTVVGARPQFIKAAPLSKMIAETEGLTEVMVHTGQHYDYALSQQFFDELEIPPPAYNLEVGSGRHVVQMSEIMRKFDAVLEIEQPDLVIVFGDTNSTAAAAIVAAKNHIPLAHIEAGLREFNKATPEEINKMLTDAVTDLYFPPTKTGVKNLEKQGISKNIYLTGDIGIDLIHNNLDKINNNTDIFKRLNLVTKSKKTISKHPDYYFLTCHRAANTDNITNFQQIMAAVAQLNAPVVFPIHPRTRVSVEQNGLGHLFALSHLKLIEPIGFWDTQTLIRHAKMVLTDSGGVIKEAYYHHVGCIILQNEIEWIEAVEEGWAQLSGNQTERILTDINTFTTPSVYSGFLGNGQAAKRIVEAILTFLNARLK